MSQNPHPVPAGFLQAPEEKLVSVLQIVILLYHMHRGNQLADVGFEDARETLESLTQELAKRKVKVQIPHLESALWSANLMNEIGKFWHPRDRSFDEFLRELGIKKRFDKTYNLVGSGGSND